MRRVRQTRSHAWTAVLLLLLLMTGSPALGEDHGEHAPPLAVRVFHVGALTMGKTGFTGEQAPPVGPDDVSDEENPLFGGEGEEPIYPVGQIEELIELLKSSVDPLSWEEIEGADAYGRNEHTLVVHNRPAVLDHVARWLARLEQQVLRTAVIEVRTRRVAKDSPEGPSLSLSAFVNQRISGFSGSQHAHLVDYDVEVQKGAQMSDPIVMVSNVGLGVDALLLPGDPTGDVSLEIHVRMSALEEERTVAAGERRFLEVPRFAVTNLRAVIHVTPGRWTPLPGGGDERGWLFEVRVTLPTTTLPTSTSTPYPTLSPPVGENNGLPPSRMFEVHDLLAMPLPVMGWHPYLMPSNYTPREPPELPEPTPIFPADNLVQFLQSLSSPGTWNDPMSMEARNGLLIARNRPEVLASLESLLARIRRDSLWTVTAQLEIIELPSSLLDGLRQGPGSVLVLSGSQRDSLDAVLARGSARRLSQMDVSCHDGVPSAIQSGSFVPYLQDYQVELSEQSATANPVVQNFFSGLALAVKAGRTTGGRHVSLEVRATRSTHPTPLRRVDTAVGPMECPKLDLFRVRTGLLVPLGSSVLLAVEGEGDMRRVMLLTPRLPR